MKRLLPSILFSAIFLLAACASEPSHLGGGKDDPAVQPSEEKVTDMLHLCVGDSYDFYAMDYIVDAVEGDVLQEGNVVHAAKAGTGRVWATDMRTGERANFAVRAYASSQELGGQFFVDRGMFKGKNAIVFGDSITDGCLLDPTAPNTQPNGFNYKDTYFAKLCYALQTATDPTDPVLSNMACGGTTLVPVKAALSSGISGVERIDKTQPFTDGGGREHNVPAAVAQADLCVIYYGTNDFAHGVPVSATGAGETDWPTSAAQVKSYKGGLFYLFRSLRLKNPTIKIMVLPMLFRRAGGNLQYNENRTDVVNTASNMKWSDYRAAAKQVSEDFGAKFVDWGDVFGYDELGVGVKYSADGLHPNVAGHARMYEELTRILGAEGLARA